MSCPDELVLWALVQGTADADSVRTLDAHLDECAECREVVGAVASGVRSQHTAARTPTTLGRFEVGEALGEGAMGVVYAGVDPELERPVALKVLHAAADSAKGRARLVREAQAMARLAHAHVLTVFEVGADGDTVFIAMERGEGNLRAAMNAGVGREALVTAMTQAGHGLAAAHRADILHRDFKPENVMLMADGSAKVADFGLAGLAGLAGLTGVSAEDPSDAPIELTRTGALLGTPVYMAPERLRGEVGDARSDQFSFCVAMWEVLEGTRPFGGKSVDELAKALRSGPPAPREMHDSFARVLRRGMDADPEARFDSMDALLAALPKQNEASSRRGLAVPVVFAAAALACVSYVYVAYFASDSNTSNDVSAASTATSQAAGPCDALLAPALPALEGWRGERVSLWRAQWESARRLACGVAPTERAAACLSQQSAELARIAVAGAPAETFVPLLDPLACTANAAPLRDGLIAARAHLRAGDAAQAQLTLAALASEASAGAEAAETTEAALLGARVERTLAHFDDAEELARTALFRARQDGDTWNEAEAWLELVAVAGAAGEYEQAARDLPHAEQAVRAAGVGSQREQLLHRQGVVRTQLGDFEGARSALDAAVELRTQRLGSETVELAPFHTSLGHLARLEERLGDAFEHHSAARRLNEGIDPEHTWVARDLHNLGGILRRQHRWEEALDYYERSIAIRRERLGAAHPEVALGLNSVGLVLFETADFEGAREKWREAREIFVANEHADAAMAEHNLALANLALHEPGQALQHALAALHRDEARLGPDAKRVGAELITVAKALVQLRRFDEAETRITRAKEIAVLLGDQALAAEADAVMANRRSPPSRAARATAPVEAAVDESLEGEVPPEPTEVADVPDMEETGVSPTVSEVRPGFRAAGSGTYGGGQAWD